MKNKKQIIINIVIAIIFFIVGGIFGSKMENSRLNSIDNAIPNNTTNGQSENNQVKKEDKKDIKIIPLNQEEAFGNVNMKILNVKENEQINNEAGKSSSSGKFIVIELSLKNNDKQAIQYDSNQFELLTKDDVVYQVDDVAFDAMGNLNSQETIFNKNKDFIGVYDKFNAGMTKKTYIVFDVPKDLNLDNTKLILEGNKDLQFSLK